MSRTALPDATWRASTVHLDVLARPDRALDAMAVPDRAIDPVRLGRLAHVGEDGRPVRDGLRRGPGTERVAERVHVGVGADPRVAEEVPRAPEALAPLQDRVRLVRAARLQVVGGADAGEAGTHDENVEMLGWIVHRASLVLRPEVCAGLYVLGQRGRYELNATRCCHPEAEGRRTPRWTWIRGWRGVLRFAQDDSKALMPPRRRCASPDSRSALRARRRRGRRKRAPRDGLRAPPRVSRRP